MIFLLFDLSFAPESVLVMAIGVVLVILYFIKPELFRRRIRDENDPEVAGLTFPKREADVVPIIEGVTPAIPVVVGNENSVVAYPDSSIPQVSYNESYHVAYPQDDPVYPTYIPSNIANIPQKPYEEPPVPVENPHVLQNAPELTPLYPQ